MLQDMNSDNKFLMSQDLVNLKIDKLKVLKSYYQLAWDLAVVKGKDRLVAGRFKYQKFIKTKPFVTFDQKTQKLIEAISDEMRLVNEFNAEPNPFKDLDPDDNEALQNIFNDNRVLRKVQQNISLMLQLQQNIRSIKTIKNYSMWCLNIGSVLNRAASDYPVPPVDWILTLVSSGLRFVSGLFEIRYQKLTNVLPEKMPLSYSGSDKQQAQDFRNNQSGVAGAAVLFGVTFGSMSGPIQTVLGPLLVGFGTVSKVFLSLKDTVSSIQELKSEIKDKKDPKETYRLRVLTKSLGVGQNVLATAFYTCMSISAVALLISAFGGPIGIGAVVGTLAAISLGIAVASLVVLGIKQFALWRIKKIEKEHGLDKKENLLVKDLSRKLDLTHQKKLENQEDNKLSSKNPPVSSPLIVKRVTDKSELQFKSKSVMVNSYRYILNDSGGLLANLNKDPLYQGVKTDIKANPYPHEGYHDLNAIQIKVSNQQSTRAPHDNKQKDNVSVSICLNQSKEVETKLSSSSNERAIMIALQMNKEFQPLKMQACGEALVALKVYEAAKLSAVTIALHADDIKLLREHKDPKVQEYFRILEKWSPAEFKRYYQAKLTDTKKLDTLGQVPTESQLIAARKIQGKNTNKKAR